MAKIKANVNDPIWWFQSAENMRKGAAELFHSVYPLLWFPAVLLGHQALEMFLKAALIRQGLKIDRRRRVRETWGHKLTSLGKQLTADGKCKLNDDCFEVLQIFDEYFQELR